MILQIKTKNPKFLNLKHNFTSSNFDNRVVSGDLQWWQKIWVDLCVPVVTVVWLYRRRVVGLCFYPFLFILDRTLYPMTENPKTQNKIQIKYKPIQKKKKKLNWSNISYPNLKNGRKKKKQCTVPNQCSDYHSTSFSVSFSVSQASSSLYFWPKIAIY